MPQLTHASHTSIYNFEEGDTATILSKRASKALPQKNSWEAGSLNFIGARKRTRRHTFSDESNSLLLANLVNLFFMLRSGAVDSNAANQQLTTVTAENYKKILTTDVTEVLPSNEDFFEDVVEDLSVIASAVTSTKSTRYKKLNCKNTKTNELFNTIFFPASLELDPDTLSYFWFQDLINSVFFSKFLKLNRVNSLNFFGLNNMSFNQGCVYLASRCYITGHTPRITLDSMLSASFNSTTVTRNLFFDVAGEDSTISLDALILDSHQVPTVVVNTCDTALAEVDTAWNF